MGLFGPPCHGTQNDAYGRVPFAPYPYGTQNTATDGTQTNVREKLNRDGSNRPRSTPEKWAYPLPAGHPEQVDPSANPPRSTPRTRRTPPFAPGCPRRHHPDSWHAPNPPWANLPALRSFPGTKPRSRSPDHAAWTSEHAAQTRNPLMRCTIDSRAQGYSHDARPRAPME